MKDCYRMETCRSRIYWPLIRFPCLTWSGVKNGYPTLYGHRENAYHSWRVPDVSRRASDASFAVGPPAGRHSHSRQELRILFSIGDLSAAECSADPYFFPVRTKITRKGNSGNADYRVMPMTIHLWDEAIPGHRSPSEAITVQQARTSTRELIRSRVQQEVARYNQSLPEVFQGLVQPEESEQILNGFRMKEPRPLDWEVHYERACS